MKAALQISVLALALAIPTQFQAVAKAAGIQATPTETATVKGTIKSIDDQSIVVVPDENKKGEAAFQLTSAVKRSGTLTAGAPVVVSYHFESGKRVVTEIAGKSAK